MKLWWLVMCCVGGVIPLVDVAAMVLPTSCGKRLQRGLSLWNEGPCQIHSAGMAAAPPDATPPTEGIILE
jgi:hypothetical protein